MHRMSAALLLWCICYLPCSSLGQRDFEAELINYLKNNITNYSPLLFPRLNQTEIINISMEVLVTQIVSVDTAKQSINISALLYARWEEERLVWEPKVFGNVTVINWDSSQIWLPVILIYNGIGDNQVLTPQIPVYLESQSPSSPRTMVTSIWRREFEFSCKFDMSHFPHDRHICEIEFYFGDQGRGIEKVVPVKNAHNPYHGLAIYRENSEWRLLNMSTSAEERTYNIFKEVPPKRVPTYIIHLEIRRVSTYYFMNVIIPLLLLKLLQILVFLVPVKSEEKLGFGITIMLSYTVFLLLVDRILPKTQTMPAIASFIAAAMILSTISIMLTSIIMKLHFAPKGTNMPACVRTVFVRFLGRLLRGSGVEQVDRIVSDASESKERQSDGSVAVAVSEWVIAANAIERLMVVLDTIVTVVIIGVFVIQSSV